MHIPKRTLLLAMLAACSGTHGDTVVFGAAGPWSEAYGDANRKGIELALQQINDRPEWKQHPLRIIFKNDSGSGVRASSIAQGFVDSANVLAVVGHVNSGAMVAAAHVYAGHLVAVATTATSPSLTGVSPWTFRVISSDSVNGQRIADFANKLGSTRAAVLYENNPYGRGLADNFRRNYRGSILSIDPIAEGSEENFEAFVTWYKRARPDLIFVAGTDASGLSFLKEARRQQLAGVLVGGDGWQTLAANPLAEGIYVGAPFTAQDTSAAVRQFVADYRDKFGTTPDGNAALAYDATKLLATAYEHVGADREKIRDYLASLDATNAYEGVTGRIRFQNGDPAGKDIVITRVHEGALELEAKE